VSENQESADAAQSKSSGGIPEEIREHQREVAEYFEKYEAKGLTRRQISKRVGIAGLTIAPFAAVLSACGGSSKSDASTTATATGAANETAADVKSGKSLKFFGSNCGLVPTWYAQGNRQQKFYSDLLGVQYEYADGELDPTKQRAKIENAATKKWDIVHIDALAPGTIDDPVKKMIGNGALVFEGPGQLTRPGKEIGVKTWLHQSSFEMGNLVGHALFQAAGGKNASGNVIITRGPAAAVQVPERANGFKEAMKEYPGFKIVADDYGNWDPTTTQKLWESYVSRYKDIAVGYCQNDDMAFAAYKVLQGANRAGKTQIGGCDAMPPAIAAVKDGKFAATYRHSSQRVHVDPLFIGRALKMGLLKDTDVPRELKLDGPLVTKDNADTIAWLQQDNLYLI
jgi:ribose transport system substrate-binding protein